MRRQILHEIKMGLLAAGIGAAIFGSFLFFGMRAKAATIRDGVHSPAFAALQTMDRQELADLRSAEEWTEPVTYTAGDLDLLAAIIYAEAGDQDFEGMRLVGDCVMNRVNSPDPYWPDTVEGVIYQPHQFSPVLDGGLARAWGNVTPECYEAARLALSGDQLNTEIIYFSMYGCANGTFVFQHGCHYFGV